MVDTMYFWSAENRCSLRLILAQIQTSLILKSGVDVVDWMGGLQVV